VFVASVETILTRAQMCASFESSHKEESTAQSNDRSKAYSKPEAFNRRPSEPKLPTIFSSPCNCM